MSVDQFDKAWVAELLFTVDAQTGVILDAAGEVETSLGLPPADMVGMRLLAAIHRDDVASAEAAFEQTVKEGRATWEGRVLSVDGAFTDYGWDGRLGQDGRTIYAQSRDVVAARKIAADLRVYERLADLTSDLFVVSNAIGRIVKVNASVSKLHGGSAEDFVGGFLSDFVTEEGRAVIEEFPQRVMQGESLINFQLPGIRGDGSVATIEGTATFDEVTKRWYVVERDVTERVAREEELEITQRFFELSSSQLVLLDDRDRVVRANQSFLDVADVKLDDVVGRDILDAIPVIAGADVRSLLTSVRQGRVVGPREVRVRIGGSELTFEIQLSAAIEGGSVYLSCRDVTEERSLRAELLERATHDSLTGLANRASLLESIERDLSNGDFVAIVTLDLDGFKQTNDTLGHAAGDILLVRVAERLNRLTRHVDMVARMGGDEFVIMLSGVPDLATVGVVGTKISEAFAEPFDVDGRPIEISASVGATGGRSSSHTSQELLLEADLAAYAAKHGGADRCRVFDDELRTAADSAAEIEEHLRRVVAAPHFDLDVVEIKRTSGAPMGLSVIAPALCASGESRWDGESLRIAKSLGLLGPISTRMTEEAIERLAPWMRANPGCFIEIAYNPSQVSMAGFEGMLLELLAANDVDPRQFVVSLSDLGQVDATAIDPSSIAALRRSGIRVSLSESAADAHTLSIMETVGIDRIEIDGARIAAMTEGSVTRLIANTVLDIADRLGIVIVIDAGFDPEVGDLADLFGDCSPLGAVFEKPIPIAELVRSIDHIDDGEQSSPVTPD